MEKIGIVLCNSMKVSEDIDDFLKNEHHHLDVIRCVRENDMKAERRLHQVLQDLELNLAAKNKELCKVSAKFSF